MSTDQTTPWQPIGMRLLRSKFFLRLYRWRNMREHGIKWPIGLTTKHAFYQRRWSKEPSANGRR